jgi:hypothetical protein
MAIQSTSQSNNNKIEAQNVYFLISTSTKIYCLKTQFNTNNHQQEQDALNLNYDSPSGSSSSYLNSDYEIIYEELNSTNNWITDLYYDSIDNIIYVNIYDSLALKSDIIQLRYNKKQNKWVKFYLFRNQNHCLGITYNPHRRELYWTSGKSIIVGKIPKDLEIDASKHKLKITEAPKVLFNLELTKKLLYLKYDFDNEAIFVSTLNFVYVCFISKQSCNVLIQNMQSARGIYLDTTSHHLYTVDHKRKQIDRMKISSNLIEKFYPSTNTDVSKYDEMKLVSVLNNNIMPDLGDIFYVCLYKQNLLWTEFSGKLKSINVDTSSNYDILFTTNEYTYAIVVLNNSTDIEEKATTNTHTTHDNSFNDILNSDNFDNYDYMDLVAQEKEKTSKLTTRQIASTSTLLKKLLTSTTISSTKTTQKLTTTTPDITSTIPQTTSMFITSTSIPIDITTMKVEETTTIPVVTSTWYIASTSIEIIAETMPVELTSTASVMTTSVPVYTTTATTTSEEIFTTKTITTTTNVESTSTTLSLLTEELSNDQSEEISVTSSEEAIDEVLRQSTTYFEELDDLFYETTSVTSQEPVVTTTTTTTTPNVIINFKKQKLKNEIEYADDDDDIFNFIKMTPVKATVVPLMKSSSATLNIILYVISCLLCFSVIINLVFLYFTKLRRNHGKLILNHDLSDSSEHQNMKSDEIADNN